MSSANGANAGSVATTQNGFGQHNAQNESDGSMLPVISRAEIKEMNIHQRIAEIKKQCKSLPKSQQNEEEGWFYTGHDQVIELLRGLMAEFGVNIYQEPLDFTTNEVIGDLILNKVRFQYEVINADAPKDKFTRHNYGLSFGVDDKAFNKCSTISEKFFLLRLFNIATFDDPDAHAMRATGASGAPERNSKKREPKPRQDRLPRREVVTRILSLAKPLGPKLYRGILKNVAGKWKPEDVRSGALLEKVLAHMEAAARGLKRLDAALAVTGPEAVTPILDSLQVARVDKISSLKTLHALVIAMEAKAVITPSDASVADDTTEATPPTVSTTQAATPVVIPDQMSS